MDIEIINKPANSIAKVVLKGGETFTAEAGAMVAMSGDTSVTTSTFKKGGKKGGIFKALKRMLAGESFFTNHFTAGPNGGEVYVAPCLSGDMITLNLDANEPMVVQGGSFLASSPDISVDLGFQGFKSVFSGESVFWLNMAGTGQLIINSFGAIYPIDIDGEHIIDTGHIVAFPKSMEFKICKASPSIVGSILSGEGLVCKFQGKGRVWCQSHNKSSFGQTLGPMLRQRS